MFDDLDPLGEWDAFMHKQVYDALTLWAEPEALRAGGPDYWTTDTNEVGCWLGDLTQYQKWVGIRFGEDTAHRISEFDEYLGDWFSNHPDAPQQQWLLPDHQDWEEVVAQASAVRDLISPRPATRGYETQVDPGR